MAAAGFEYPPTSPPL